MQIDIEEKSLAGFNDPARAEVATAASSFVGDLIREANRIEAARNHAAKNPQVTSSMVIDADVMVRRGLAAPKKRISIRILRIVAALLSLFVGIAYDSVRSNPDKNMLWFVVLVAASILTLTLATLAE